MKKKIIYFSLCFLCLSSCMSVEGYYKPNDTILISLNSILSDTTGNWTEIQKLLPIDGSANDYFGYSVSIDGNTAIIGANYNDDLGVDSGSAYIFTLKNNTWIQEAKLVAEDIVANDLFGSAVYLSNDTALIGAINDDDNGDQSGCVYVFVRTDNHWIQQAKLLALDGATNDQFGYSISLEGDTALIGVANDDDNGDQSGSAYIFVRTDKNWTQQAKLIASDGTMNDFFGGSVSLSNNNALIGAHGDDDNGYQSGSAYIFTRNGSTWTQQVKLLTQDGAAGDYFGWSVSLSNDTALIGADGDDDQGESSGSAYIFTRTGNTWTQQAKLLASNSTAYDSFGWCISLSSNTALIGAPFDDDNGDQSGSAYIFTRSGNNWTQEEKLLVPDGAVADRFGWRLSLSNGTAIFGVRWDGDNGINSGSAYIFTKKSKNEPPIIGMPTPINGSINNPHSLTWNIPINDPDGDVFSWTIQCNNGQVAYDPSATNGTKSLSLQRLWYSTTYTIWVNASDSENSGRYSRNWYVFTTTANQPAGPPIITGPTKGKIGTITYYNFSSIDFDNDEIYYFIDWGDNTNSSWIGPYSSGEKIIKSHIWSDKGTYIVKAKVKDIYGNESNWTQLEMKMPKITMSLPSFIIEFIERFIQRFPFLSQIFDLMLG